MIPAVLALVFLAGAVVLIHAAFAAVFRAGPDPRLEPGGRGAGGVAGPLGWEWCGTGAVVALCGLLLAGWSETYSDVPAASFFLVALAPLLLGITLLPPLARLKTFHRELLDVAFVLVPLAAAVALAVLNESLPDGD